MAVYPEFSCTGKPYQYHEFCIGNPNTLTFLTDILSGLLAIFPSEYIHIGSYPPQQENTLTNGEGRAFTYSDKQWLGYLKNFDATVDMGSVQPIQEVAISAQ